MYVIAYISIYILYQYGMLYYRGMTNMSNKKITLSIEEQVDDFAGAISDNTVEMLFTQGNGIGTNTTNLLINSFLFYYLHKVLLDTLMHRAKGLTPEEAYKNVSKDFLEMKSSIQETIGQSFHSALSTFSGRPVDYYCQINIVPDPINKLPS